jgi:CubicO group peptidase (beta-lactamase class C family)
MPYEQLVKDQNRFPVGHLNGSEIETPEVPEVIAGAGAFRSTANDLLKYLSANLDLIHTTLDEPMQLQHLIQHPSVSANPMNYSEYVALGWRVLTDFGSETLTHTGSINGWNAMVGFTPAKQMGVVLLCSCDLEDANTGHLGFVLLRLIGPEILTKQ